MNIRTYKGKGRVRVFGWVRVKIGVRVKVRVRVRVRVRARWVLAVIALLLYHGDHLVLCSDLARTCT